MIEILSASALTTVQDLGRLGSYRHGVGTSGAMDQMALAVGNILLGNDSGAAGIEITIMPFRVRFLADVDFALTGADTDAHLGQQPILPYWARPAQRSQTLSLGLPKTGCRAYLTVGGGIDVAPVLGSRSTQLRGAFGGHEGRMLRYGDKLRACASPRGLPHDGFGVIPPEAALPLGGESDDCRTVRVLPAGEYDAFDGPSREAFWDKAWTVTAESNRAGYRLDGPPLRLSERLELRSHGVVPGVIQVPAGGRPIIQLADAATMGGYPKIGTVIGADLWRVGQARPGTRLRFLPVTYAKAREALAANEGYLRALRETASATRSTHWQ